jgi:hypothetical protein
LGPADLGAAAETRRAAAMRATVFQSMGKRYQTSELGASMAFGFRGVRAAWWLSLGSG